MRVVRIGKVCEVIAGQSPLGSSYNTQANGMEFHQGKRLFFGDKLLISDTFTSLPTKLAQAGDILMSVRAPVGPTVYLDRDICIGRGLAAIRPKSEGEVNIRYLYLFLKHIEKTIEVTDGAVFPSINKSQIENLMLPLPDLPEQRRIVAKLDKAFQAIDKAIKLSERQEIYTKALFNSELESLFLDQKEGQCVLIQDVCAIKGGKRLPKGSKLLSAKTPWPYVRVADFDHKGSVDLNNIQYLDEQTQKQIERYIVTDQDVFLSIAGSIGITGIVPSELSGANLTENACRLIPNDRIDKEYLYYFTLTRSFIEQAAGATRQTAQPKLALIRIKNINLLLPDINTQRSLVKKIRKLSATTNNLGLQIVEKNDSLLELKRAMLKEAFSESAVK